MKFRKKPVIIDAITFDEFVEYGKAHPDIPANVVRGMPWSFKFVVEFNDSNRHPITIRHPITHENDNCYLIPTLEGTMKFNRGDMLITGVKGEIYPIKPDIFEATYEAVE